MTPEVKFLFLLAALVCFGLAAFAPRVSPRVSLTPLGLALFIFPGTWESAKAIF